jgi:hypothetical protein
MAKGILAAAAALFTALATGCASNPPPLQADPAGFAAGLGGAYDNTLQWTALSEGLRASSGLLPAQVRFVRATAVALGGVVIYEEWRSTAPGARPIRQRLWLARTAGQDITLERFSFLQPELFLGAGADALTGLTPNTVRSLGPGCHLRVRFADADQWDATGALDACRSETGAVINTRITRTPGALLYAETGAGEDPLRIGAPVDLRKR